MCVIVYKPADKQISNDIVEKCFKSNGHGAGFMYRTENGLIRIKKGIFKVEQLLEEIGALQNADLVLHMRISTAGKINAYNCHPFPVDERQGNRTDFLTKTAFCHNGHISGFGNSKHSDTAEFANRILHQVAKVEHRIKLLTAIGGSKFCYMDDEAAHLVGDFTEEEGIHYSNMRWKPYVYNYPSRVAGSGGCTKPGVYNESPCGVGKGWAQIPSKDEVPTTNLKDDIMSRYRSNKQTQLSLIAPVRKKDEEDVSILIRKVAKGLGVEDRLMNFFNLKTSTLAAKEIALLELYEESDYKHFTKLGAHRNHEIIEAISTSTWGFSTEEAITEVFGMPGSSKEDDDTVLDWRERIVEWDGGM